MPSLIALRTIQPNRRVARLPDLYKSFSRMRWLSSLATRLIPSYPTLQEGNPVDAKASSQLPNFSSIRHAHNGAKFVIERIAQVISDRYAPHKISERAGLAGS